MIQHNHVRAPANLPVIAKALGLAVDGAAVHAHPNAIATACGLRHAIVQIPNLQAALVIPAYPFTINRIVPVPFFRNRFPSPIAKSFFAIAAKTWTVPAKARPTVVRESFRMIAFDNFAQDGGNMLLVVRAVDASYEKIVGLVGLAIASQSEPIRVCAIKIL